MYSTKTNDMKTLEDLQALIDEAKECKRDFSTSNAADKFHNDIEAYAESRSESVASQQGIIRAHLEVSIMTLLDEINNQQREINLYKETINSIS